MIRENEISSAEAFFKTGTLRLRINGTDTDVKYYINRSGFHIQDFIKTDPIKEVVALMSTVRLFPSNGSFSNQSKLSRRGIGNNRILNPSFSRPDLLTGLRSVQPGKK